MMNFGQILRLLRRLLRVDGDIDAARKGKLDKRLARRGTRKALRKAGKTIIR